MTDDTRQRLALPAHLAGAEPDWRALAVRWQARAEALQCQNEWLQGMFLEHGPTETAAMLSELTALRRTHRAVVDAQNNLSRRYVALETQAEALSSLALWLFGCITGIGMLKHRGSVTRAYERAQAEWDRRWTTEPLASWHRAALEGRAQQGRTGA